MKTITTGYAPADLNGKHLVLVKFGFTNRNRLPNGLRQNANTRPDMNLDERHARWVRDQGLGDLAQVGRIRQGRVDTGEELIKGLVVNPFSIHSSLIGAGFCLTKEDPPHWYVQRKKKGRNTVWKYWVVLPYWCGTKPEDELHLEGDQARQILAFFKRDYNCRLWSNPDGTITVNFPKLADQKESLIGNLDVEEDNRGFQIVITE